MNAQNVSKISAAVAALCMTVATSAFGQSTAIQKDHIRSDYSGTRADETPDEIAFLVLLKQMGTPSPDSVDIHLLMVEKNMNYSGQEAEDFRDYLFAMADSFAQERAIYIEREICPRNKIRPQGDQLYSLFDASEDAAENTAKELLLHMQSTLPAETFDLFRSWLARKKSKFSYTKYHHRNNYERMNANIDLRAIQYCARFDARVK